MSHLNLPERIHEKPIEDNYYEVCGVRIPIHVEKYDWDAVFKPKEGDELFTKATKGLTAKWVDTRIETEKTKLTNLHMGGAKELADIAIIQNPQGNVYYHKKSDVEEMQILKEKVALTMYGLI